MEIEDADIEAVVETRIMRPPLRAVVLDNDETTGSYGIVFSILGKIRKNHTIENDLLELIYIRLAEQMKKYELFRPGLGHLLRTLAFLKDEMMLDTVIMYTNQTEEVQYNPYGEFKSLLYNVPYTISYLMYAAFRLNIFDDVLSRPVFLRGLTNAVCTKSFTRIFALDTDRPKHTAGILFVDDNASPKFITASPDTVVCAESYYRIGAYVRVLDDAELDALLAAVFEGTNVMDDLLTAIKTQYREYSPLSKMTLNNVGDRELMELNKVVVEKYV